MKKVIIIGGGPAGLSAAIELLKTPDICVVIYEAEDVIGGLSRTLEFDGNKIDIGPHRFFSKSEQIVDLWKTLGPQLFLEKRYTRIYFSDKFFDYPLKLNINFFLNVGIVRLCKIIFSYFKSVFSPRKNEDNLEDFFINKFGEELYLTFFKDYTEKVWGIPCKQISSEWGSQRVRGISIIKILKDNLKIFKEKNNDELEHYFYYPQLGAGMMWNFLADEIKSKGGKIYTNKKVIAIKNTADKIVGINVKDTTTGEITEETADYIVSSMPVVDLISQMQNVDKKVSDIANNLEYRDIIVVGLVFEKFKKKVFKDHWIYLQDGDVLAGRMEIYNNFSSKMLKDKNKVCVGLEYFCNKNDEIWSKSDEEIIKFAVDELSKINIFYPTDFIEGKVYRIEKAYPKYFGAYDRFDEIKEFVDGFKNLILIGRNGMHRYNNMDHSMMCGITAARNIVDGKTDNNNIWDINLEKNYHESK